MLSAPRKGVELTTGSTKSFKWSCTPLQVLQTEPWNYWRLTWRWPSLRSSDTPCAFQSHYDRWLRSDFALPISVQDDGTKQLALWVGKCSEQHSVLPTLPAALTLCCPAHDLGPSVENVLRSNDSRCCSKGLLPIAGTALEPAEPRSSLDASETPQQPNLRHLWKTNELRTALQAAAAAFRSFTMAFNLPLPSSTAAL